MTLKEIFIFSLILLFALFGRLLRLNYPSQMYFDEVYHVPAAMMFSDGNFVTPFDHNQTSYDGQNVADWLHPPLAKYFQALSINLIGKNPLAWRLPSLIFSILSLIAFYFLLRLLGKNVFFKKENFEKKNELATLLALLGTFLLSLDGLFLVQSRIAMNDIFVLFFILLAVFCYFVYSFSKNYLYLLLTGIVLGLALASKWTALWIILLFFIKELLSLNSLRKLPFLIFSLILTPLFIYLLCYLPMFLTGKTFFDFLLLQKTIALSQLTNPNAHLYSSGSLSWLLNLRPVWFFMANSTNSKLLANIYALDNPLLSLYLFLAFLLTIIFLLSDRKSSFLKNNILFIFSIYLANFLPWIVFSRPMFIYHYLPAIPFLMILLSYFLINFLRKITDHSKKKAIAFNLIFWPFFFFLLFYPHWTALPVPKSFANAVYFFIPNWR